MAASKTVNVLLEIKQGRDLAAKDRGGTSDPYCTIALEDPNGKPIKGFAKQKTKVVKKTLNPVWDQPAFKIVLPINTAGIRIEVWDKDLMGKDFMGETIIPTDLIVKGGDVETWFPLLDKPGKKLGTVSGDLLVRYVSTGLDPADRAEAADVPWWAASGSKSEGVATSTEVTQSDLQTSPTRTEVDFEIDDDDEDDSAYEAELERNKQLAIMAGAQQEGLQSMRSSGGRVHSKNNRRTVCLPSAGKPVPVPLATTGESPARARLYVGQLAPPSSKSELDDPHVGLLPPTTALRAPVSLGAPAAALPVPAPAVHHEPEPAVHHEPEPSVHHEPEPEPAVHHEPEPAVHHEPEPAVHHEPEPAVHHEPEPAVHHEPEPAVHHEPEPAVHHEPEPAVHHEPEPAVHHEPEPAVHHEPEPAVHHEPEPAVHHEPEPAPVPVVHYEPKPEPAPAVEREPTPEPTPAPAPKPTPEPTARAVPVETPKPAPAAAAPAQATSSSTLTKRPTTTPSAAQVKPTSATLSSKPTNEPTPEQLALIRKILLVCGILLVLGILYELLF